MSRKKAGGNWTPLASDCKMLTLNQRTRTSYGALPNRGRFLLPSNSMPTFAMSIIEFIIATAFPGDLQLPFTDRLDAPNAAEKRKIMSGAWNFSRTEVHVKATAASIMGPLSILSQISPFTWRCGSIPRDRFSGAACTLHCPRSIVAMAE